MLIRLQKTYIIYFLANLVIKSAISLQETSWLDNLIKYVKKDANPYQLLVLCDDNKENLDFGIDKIIKKIEKRIPIIKIGFNNTTENKSQDLKRLPAFKNPVSTTMYLMIASLKKGHDLSLLSKPINFLTNLAQSRRRSKCLIILHFEERSYTDEQLLREMWNRKFLDATVLYVIKSATNKVTLQSGYGEQRMIIQYFNPFTGNYLQQNYSSKSEWFPGKLRNLQGWKLKIAFFERPSFLEVAKNNEGHLIPVEGHELKNIQTISEKLNFEAVFLNYPGFGANNCDKEKNVNVLYSLMLGQIDLCVHHMQQLAPCPETFLEFGIPTEQAVMGTLIPRISSEKFILSYEWQIANVVTILTILTSLKTISWLLKFDANIWNPSEILRILCGFGLPREPQRVPERILFGSLLVISVLFSSAIYSAVTNVEIQLVRKLEISSLEKLYESEIVPLISPTIYLRLVSVSEGTGRKLLQKSVQKVLSIRKCSEMSMKYKNVSCFMNSEQADMMINQLRNADGQPRGLFLGPIIPVNWRHMFFESGSPFVGRFSELQRRIMQSGLFVKWKSDSSNKRRGIHYEEEEKVSQKLLFQLCLVLAFGYGLAFLVFVIEILLSFFR